MKIKYSHIIVVPARAQTVNPALMACLVQQMLFLGGQFFFLVSMPEGNEPAVTQTADLLCQGLPKIGIKVLRMNSPLNSGPADHSVTDEKTKTLIQQALNLRAPGEADVLVVVVDLEYAQKMGRIILVDFLKVRGIRTDIDQRFSPGEAGIVDCRGKTRDALHPQGYEKWARSVLTGALS